MRIEPVPVGQIIDLRWRILRSGMPRDAAMFDGDNDPLSAHFAARDERGSIVGCVSVHRRPFPGGDGVTLSATQSTRASQVRGMSVDLPWRGTGLGTKLLGAVEAHVLAAAGRGEASAILWCNARKPAVPFYQRHGWLIVSDEFDVPTAGPHHRMVRRLTP